MKLYLVSAVALTNELSQLAVRKLKKKDALKNVGKWECEIGQDWSARSNIEAEGISESEGNVSDHHFIASTVTDHQQIHFKASDEY